MPDADQVEKSIRARHYVDRLPLYYLQCAHEEQCLSSSAYGANVPQSNERLMLLYHDHNAWFPMQVCIYNGHGTL